MNIGEAVGMTRYGSPVVGGMTGNMAGSGSGGRSRGEFTLSRIR